tara:strand:- start:287 stop:550 length:264 start_codon:yes stop_codon:yes gene_type:complete
MRRHQFVIEDRTYVLSEEEQAEDAKQAVLDAVRDGGGYVEFATAEATVTDVLITPSSNVRIEHTDVIEHDHPANPFDDRHIDLDAWR